MLRKRFTTNGSGGNYFPARSLDFISSGCSLLDCAIGGGWPLGRIANIVGDSSVGKTLLAIEAAANCARTYPKGKIWYREAEAAFDLDYAKELGLPVDHVDFGPRGINTRWDTVEDIFEDMAECTAKLEKLKVPGLYIIDSLDALSTRTRMKKDIDKGAFSAAQKAARINELFERFAREFRAANICVLIVSQVRYNIGVTYGEKMKRSGGKGMDFYCSQVLWLRRLKVLTQERHGIERATAIRVEAYCKKNKITRPFGKCEFVLRFNYGIDDLEENLDFLDQTGHLKDVGLTPKELKPAALDKLSNQDYRQLASRVDGLVKRAWYEVDENFKPLRKKYGDATEQNT